MKPARIALSMAALAFCALGLMACADLHTLSRAQEIDREVRRDRLEFTEKMRDAYLILGYEYYKLAEEARAAGHTQSAEEYYKRATLYSLFQNDMDRKAKHLRWTMTETDQPAPGNRSAAPATAPALAPGAPQAPAAAPSQPTGFRPLGQARQPASADYTTLPPLEP